ncbi:hypothetical protein [Paramicrobacterium fandaimingii]|uniref:hypothetical protein n=1 Tax=Paramicrobacterium fandaimingii TaxID=2708079 RepID=UPI00141F66E8|nr:hypothetical protein [Microbacterium fandaimingii]
MNAAAQEACADFAVTHMIDVLIAETHATEQQVARETLKTVLEPFVEEIVNADLDEAEARNIETAVNNLHIICALCVETLKLIDQVKSLANAAADVIAQSVADGLGDHTFLTTAVKAVLKDALTRSFEAVIALAADPVKVKMLRVIGFATCPNVKAHPEVEKYCVAPLANEYVTASLQEWIDQNFPSDSALLKRAPRRNKKKT